MQIYITLDYELFFGSESGSAAACIVDPTEALLAILDPLNIKLTLFVDAGYLMALKRQMEDYPQLKADYDLVAGQMKRMSDQGHSIQLHIHPHWEDSYFKDGSWQFNTDRYRLSAFSPDQVQAIVTNYHDQLKQITGVACTAYRAGGWSAQPFGPIGEALRREQIFVDSTVFPGGFYDSEDQCYDFTAVAMNSPRYRFNNDLTTADPKGDFTEIPIAAYKVSPLFFWKFAALKVLKNVFNLSQHKAYGNGSAIAKERQDVIRLLTQSSNTVVSIDGYKASYLKSAFKSFINNTSAATDFVIIGHPKAFTPYSLKKTFEFTAATNDDHQYSIF